MSTASRIHTPLYASHPTGRRSMSCSKRIVESVLPDELVAQIRKTQFDDMLDKGFPNLPFFGKAPVSTLKLTLTPSIARDTAVARLSCHQLHLYSDYFYVSYA